MSWNRCHCGSECFYCPCGCRTLKCKASGAYVFNCPLPPSQEFKDDYLAKEIEKHKFVPSQPPPMLYNGVETESPRLDTPSPNVNKTEKKPPTLGDWA